MVNTKVDHSLGELLTAMSPPIRFTSLLEITNPIPVPPNFLSLALSNWEKLLKSLSRSVGAIPIPVSVTEK